MASFYIPMALSLSANLAHLTPIHGLYAFAVQPLVYALLGSCPTMAVGPEVGRRRFCHPDRLADFSVASRLREVC